MFKRQNSTVSSSSTSISPNQQQLHGLNLDFLRVLQAVQRSDSRSSYHGLRLIESNGESLLNLDSSALQRVAGCNFSLFSLQWHRADEWTRLAEHSTTNRDQAQTTVNAPDDAMLAVLNFMQCAVFFGWHLAQQDERAARFMLGMSAETAAVMRSLDLAQCRYIGQGYRKLLTPRWLHNRYFWSDLLHYGNSGEAEHFKLIQLLGTQLMAQDLEPSAIARHSAADAE